MVIAVLNYKLNPLSKDITTTCKLIYIKMNSTTQKIEFSCCVIQNNNRSINSIFVKKAKYVLTFDFSTLHTKISHNKLLAELNSNIEFTFTGGARDKNIVLNNTTYWIKNNGKMNGYHYSLTMHVSRNKALVASMDEVVETISI